jgi:septum formation protein
MTGSSLILASASTRRHQLLQQLGVAFTVSVQDIDERKNDEESPEEFVARMADEKASAALLSRTENNVIILASDTVVVCEDLVLGKPKDKSDGLKMLRRLSNNTHRVLSAVTIATAIKRESILSETTVQFREISELEAEQYWETGEPADKAGAYGIQGYAAVFVKSISGSYSGVMGLPLYETAELLSDYGIAVWQPLQESD